MLNTENKASLQYLGFSAGNCKIAAAGICGRWDSHHPLPCPTAGLCGTQKQSCARCQRQLLVESCSTWSLDTMTSPLEGFLLHYTIN